MVSILKDLPLNVRLVCARSNQTTTQTDISMSTTPTVDRLVKAKSDGSISSSSLATTTTGGQDPLEGGADTARSTTSQSKSKLKSRSLEPLTSLAMWCEEVNKSN